MIINQTKKRIQRLGLKVIIGGLHESQLAKAEWFNPNELLFLAKGEADIEKTYSLDDTYWSSCDFTDLFNLQCKKANP